MSKTLHEMSEDEVMNFIKTDPEAFMKKAYEEFGIKNSGFEYRNTPDFDLEGFELRVVHSEGGSEGQGEYVERVAALIKDGEKLLHFKVTGCYYSYDGTTWDDDFEIVYPREVVVTQYFKTP